jgi:hypothetical protein
MENNQLKIYSEVTTLPLRRFIQVVVDGNMAALVISGVPTAEDTPMLQAAWQTIYTQYIDLLGDGAQQVYLQALKAVAILKINIQLANSFVEVLTKIQPVQVEADRADQFNGQVREIESKLNKLLGTNFQFNRQDPEAYLKLLKGCSNRAKAFKIDLDLKEIHLKALDAKREAENGDENKGYSRAYFQSMLITISDHAKYEITDDITVFQFCERIRRYNSLIEKLQKQSNG